MGMRPGYVSLVPSRPPRPFTSFMTTIENPSATSPLVFALDGVGLAAEPVICLTGNSELISDRWVKSSS